VPIKKTKGLNINTKIGLFSSQKKILPVLVGNIAVNHFKEGFRRSGGKTDASIGGWKPRKRNRDRGRAVLVKTGNLRDDIKRRSTSFSRTVVGTRSADYSSYHNEGTSRLPQREHIGDSRVMDRKIEQLITKSLDNIFK
jgi:hypothetical protein